MKWEDHVNAIQIWNNACSRTVGASSEGAVEAPTELGLILIGAGVPTNLPLIENRRYGFVTVATFARERLRAAHWLRELADRLTAHELLLSTEQSEDVKELIKPIPPTQ